LKEDGFWLSARNDGTVPVLIVGQNEKGALCGAFEFLMLLGQNKSCPTSYASSASAVITD
jgi:alpha-glucuronidase